MSMWAVGFNYYMLGSDTMEITGEREREQKKGDNIIKKEIVSTTHYHECRQTQYKHTHTHNRK